MIRINSIAGRFYALIALAVLAVAGVAGLSTYELTATNRTHRAETLRSLTDTALSSVGHFADLARSGALDEAAAKKAALTTLSAMRYDGNEYFFVIDFDARMVMHPIKPELDGQDLASATDPAGAHLFKDMAQLARNGGGYYSYLWPRPGAEQPVPKTSYLLPFPAWGWAIGTGVYVDDVAAENRASVIWAALSTLLVAALLVLVAGLLTRTITRPMKALRVSMADIAEGRQAVVAGLDRSDEVGEMARAVDVFRRNAEERDALRAEQERAEHDRQRRREAVERLISGFGGDVGRQLDAVMSEMSGLDRLAGDLSTAGEETERLADAAAQGAEQSATSASAVASASDELRGAISEISQQIARTSEVTSRAAEMVDGANKRVGELAELAVAIGEVVTLIDNIAAQTNLLALNATIEAARAGETGKGFAVVASEVKSLAAQTAKATSTISEKIESIQSSTGGTVEAIRSIGVVMNEVQSYTTAISAAIEEQGVVTGSIAANIGAVSSGAAELTRSVGGVTAAAEKSRAAAGSVFSTSAGVTAKTAELRQRVRAFLDDVAAA
ncbi:putative Methyl-accepting chemotaxis receptor protein [uncultured Pleomorphomonas sp.]|uniref:Putative Methyl-accepting chemotaxis receptor protein n=1 Tax=uncultured Pleomorphomonas sp. TaxID=442121 RepID=A0A212LI71_9HYPH|nr:cache domain-containing protein [uncultured Pleomorphomonas sp.]SCM77187.1 putative Methyl-accepting chemotaxis receptor protein [uncultured Pleomorphomonas sp.]